MNLFRQGHPVTFRGRMALIVAVGLVVRLTYLVLIAADNPLSGDASSYHLAANLWADGLGFPEPLRHLFGGMDVVLVDEAATTVVQTPIGHVEPTAGHPPIWTMILGVASFLGATSIVAQQFVAVLMGLPAIVLMGLLGREVRSERLGLLAAALTAVYAFIWVNDGLLMAETAAIATATATMLMGVRFWRAPTVRSAAVLGLVGGVAALTRAELVLFLPLVAGVVLLRSTLPWRARLVRYTVCGLAALLLCLPWFIRNTLAFDTPVLFSNGMGTVLVQANCDATYHGPDLGYWNLECGLPTPYGRDGSLLNEVERDEVARDRAAAYVSDNRGRLLSVVVPARIGRMWGVYEPIGQLRRDVLADRRSFAVSALGLVQFTMLVPAAAAGIVLVGRRRGPLLVLAAWIPIATLTAASAFGNTRYRTAAETSIVILAAVAIDAAFGWWTDRRGASHLDPSPIAVHAPGGSS
ncbi:MAG: glycosyltransferase family 39 protein [Acidimicrobiales bacterium]|nr:hypothetical protein [Acidimicrobiaceae bacterium]MCH2422173.1 glycosyltransferase family 39 protein [Acidimicrobiales bacterium]